MCKARHIFRQEVDDNEHKVYGTTTFAFQVDWTKDSLFAFNLMTDHFKDIDAADTANMIFQPHITAIKALDVNVQFNKHLSFANDPIKQYALGHELIGSVANWCAKHRNCPVVLPKLPVT